MTMLAFHALFPEEAENEYRSVHPMNDDSLPSHAFVLSEAYCVEPACDCRRVMLNVLDTETDTHVATINYKFEHSHQTMPASKTPRSEFHSFQRSPSRAISISSSDGSRM